MFDVDEKKYKIICYMEIEAEDQEPLTIDEARKELEHLKLLQPENIYKIRPIDPDEASFGNLD